MSVFEEVPPLAGHAASRPRARGRAVPSPGGRARVQVGDDEHRAGPGSAVFAPRGVPHSQRRVVPASAGLLIVATPGGFEASFASSPRPSAPGRSGPDAYAAASERYGITWPDPQRVACHGTNPRPAQCRRGRLVPGDRTCLSYQMNTRTRPRSHAAAAAAAHALARRPRAQSRRGDRRRRPRRPQRRPGAGPRAAARAGASTPAGPPTPPRAASAGLLAQTAWRPRTCARPAASSWPASRTSRCGTARCSTPAASRRRLRRQVRRRRGAQPRAGARPRPALRPAAAAGRERTLGPLGLPLPVLRRLGGARPVAGRPRLRSRGRALGAGRSRVEPATSCC